MGQNVSVGAEPGRTLLEVINTLRRIPFAGLFTPFFYEKKNLTFSPLPLELRIILSLPTQLHAVRVLFELYSIMRLQLVIHASQATIKKSLEVRCQGATRHFLSGGPFLPSSVRKTTSVVSFPWISCPLPWQNCKLRGKCDLIRLMPFYYSILGCKLNVSVRSGSRWPHLSTNYQITPFRK